jgi:RNA polymerase sigma-70 factor (ECF subfamily)
VDEALLMERVRARDALAFEALYDAHHRLVYGIALRVLADTRKAEDVTQGVFLKIWSQPEAFRQGNFAGWIARVTRNSAIDVLRRDSNVQEEEMTSTIPAADALEDDVVRTLEGNDVRRAIAAIPQEQRELIELGFFGGLTHEQIARRTGVPLGTVKTRIRSGLQRLRLVLEGARAR